VTAGGDGRLRVTHPSSTICRVNDAATADEAGTSAIPEAGAGVLVFEQPLNERMRTFLRLDFLYNQALYHNEMASPWGSRAAMSSLIDILSITTRGDVRSDVLKELESQLTTLNEFQSNPGVDSQRLKSLISNLTRLRTDLMSAGSAFLQPLRDSEFLSAIKHRSAIPGGTCEFDLPDYYFWLSQPEETRMRAFNQWLGLLRPMCDAIAELLWLTRQNGRSRQESAKGGSFSITFERDNPLQLLRISLPASAGLYPEISGSHHRCSMRFLSWNGLASRPTQTQSDVTFLLSCCA
jgi:cell division protein ZapD